MATLKRPMKYRHKNKNELKNPAQALNNPLIEKT
jgi:hypothetical protein